MDLAGNIAIVVAGTAFAVAISLALARSAAGGGGLIELNMVSWAYYSSLLPDLVSSALAIFGFFRTHYMARYLADSKLNTVVWVLCLATCVVVALTMYGAGAYLGVRKLRTRFVSTHVAEPISKRQFGFVLTLATLVSVSATIYVVQILGRIPLMERAVLTATDVSAARWTVKSAFPGNQYVKNLLAVELGTILSYVCYAYCTIDRSIWARVLAGVNVLSAVLMVTSSHEKGPLVSYALGFALVSTWVGPKRKSSLRTRCLAYCLIGAMVTWFLYLEDGNVLRVFTVNGLLGRLSIGQIAPVYLYLRVFPDVREYLAGRNYPRLVAYFSGEECVRASKIVMQVRTDYEYAGYMSTLFIGEAYANWGWIGIASSMLAVGLIYEVMYCYFLRAKKTPILLGAFAYVAIEMGRMINGGFYDFVYSPSLVFAMGVFLILQTLYLKKLVVSNEGQPRIVAASTRRVGRTGCEAFR